MRHPSSSPLGRANRVALGIAVAALLFAGCGANMAPLLNVANTPVTGAPPGADPTPFVRQSILRAIAARGWTVDEEKPGVITTTVRKNELYATVDVTYTGQAFSITHRSSAPEFKFDGEHIHKRYNHWIDRLRASIVQELSRTTQSGTPVPAVASPD
jgi:hypothetical protein